MKNEKKIKQPIRLYRAHDLDLITFMETHEFNIIKAMYSSLISFSKKQHFVIEIPPTRTAKLTDIKRVYAKTLSLDVEKDREAIEILYKIQKGYRNNFLKNLLRMYLCNPLSEEFLINVNDTEFFQNYFEIFKENRRIAKAGKLTNEKKQNNIYVKKNVTENIVKNKESDSLFGMKNEFDDGFNNNILLTENKKNISEKKEDTLENDKMEQSDEDLTNLFAQIIS